MKCSIWWTSIFLLLVSQTYAEDHVKSQDSDLKADAKDILKTSASSTDYSSSLASGEYSSSEKQPQDILASSSSVSSSVSDSGAYNQADQTQSQYSQPLSYSQPGSPVQPIHSYSQPINYAPQALPYTVESQQIAQQYNTADSNYAQNQYQSIKDVPTPEVPSTSASSSSNYYPQYPAHQAYNPQLAMQSQASAPSSDYQNNVMQTDQQYESNQANYVQPAQNQQVYLHHQNHLQIPGSSYSEQSYVVENDKNAANNGYPQANGYSQPLPLEYSPEYASQGANVNVQPPTYQPKPKKTVILAIPVKLVAKNKYSAGQNNGGYQEAPRDVQGPREIQTHYTSNVVPAAANLPVVHEKNNYYPNNEGDKSFQEKPLYADKPSYTDKTEEHQKVNHNLNNNLQNNGYNSGEYEQDGGNEQNYRGPVNHGPSRYNVAPFKPNYNAARDVKPLSNYQPNRARKPQGYGPEIYSHTAHGPEYTTGNGPSYMEEEIQMAPSPDHSNNAYPVGELEHNHIQGIHNLPPYGHKQKLNDVYESPVDHLPPPYIPSDFPSLSGPSLGGSLHGLPSLGNPMDLIYPAPYKLAAGPPKHHPSLGGYNLRPSLLSSASSQVPTSTSSSSNYGQFLSSLLGAYSLGGLKPSSSKPSSSKGGIASYLNNLPGLDLLKGYSSLSPSYSSSLLTSASGLNKYYLPKPASLPVPMNNKQNQYLGWPSSELPQQAKPKPTGLLASSSNIVSSIDELFKSSLVNPTSKFRKPIYSDATRAITNLYKKLLN